MTHLSPRPAPVPAPGPSGAASLARRAGFALKAHLPIIAVAVAAVGTSFVLVPSSREHAVMDLDAGRMDDAIARLERQVKSGDHSAWTLSTLARAREQAGDPAGAVRELETLARLNPKKTSILQSLADGYQAMGRIEDHAAVLHRMQALAPSADRQRTLVRIEGELGRTHAQRDALRALIERFGGAPDDYHDLARLEAATGRLPEATAALATLQRRHPASVNVTTVAWEMSLRIVAGQPERALERGRAWLDLSDRRDGALRLAEVFAERRLPTLAVALLTTYAGERAPPELVAALAGAEYDAGDVPAAQRRLAQFESIIGRAPDRAAGLLHLRLALALDNTRSALSAAANLDPGTLAPDLLSGLAAAALRSNRLDMAETIYGLGETALEAVDPLVAAQLALALGHPDESRRRIEAAADRVAGDPGRTVALAGLQLRLGLRDRALASLREATAIDIGVTGAIAPADIRAGVASTAGGPPRAVSCPAGSGEAAGPSESTATSQMLAPALLWDVARLYIQAGAAGEASSVLAAVRCQHPSPEADRAWSLATLMAGRPREVKAWLSGEQGRPIAPAFLRDIAGLAMQAGAFDLAADAAARLVGDRGRDEDRLLLAEARIAAGRPWLSSKPPALPPSAALDKYLLSSSIGRSTVR